ncbi:unnamed protein product [Arabis nemorensis]|uniref:NADH dehydrogenase [ubiquinone] 1 alpha subcomplex subunit 13 n=1 Tax=Arabis nemorensis TaxID=586526 RepID=A0A565AKS0_9BRAS|nr:unnamed protein product [Arabis nemorensis]
MYQVGQGNKIPRALKEEKYAARQAILPILQAEEDERERKADSLEDAYFGVHQEQFYARKLKPVGGPYETIISLYLQQVVA